MTMSKLPALAWFLLISTTLHHHLSARILAGPPQNHHHNHHSIITFYMPNVLSNYNTPSSQPTRPSTTKFNGTPVGNFNPPTSRTPLTNSIPSTTIPTPQLETQTLNIPGIRISFPTSSSLREELEFGLVTPIEVGLLQSSPTFDSQLLGKAKGMYVASSEDGTSHMMAMTTSFVSSKFKDELRFFGVHRIDMSESHVAVIGGTGKYEGANGYATIKTVNVSSKSMGKEDGTDNKKFLLFNVYLG